MKPVADHPVSKPIVDRRVGTTRRFDVAAWVDWIILAIGLSIEASMPPGIWGDGELRFRVLSELLEHGKLHGAKYSMLMPFAASPLWWLGHALGKTESVTAYANMVFFGALLVALGWSLARDLPGRQLRACLILLVYASMFPHHIHAFYGEVFTAVAVTMGILWLSSGRSFAGYTAIVLGAVNTPAALVGVVAVALQQARRTRRWMPLLLPVVVWLLTRAEAWAVHGGAFKTGYENDAGYKTMLPYSGLPGFSYPWILGVLAILMSFGKGLIFFTPGLFAWPSRTTSDRVRWVHATCVAFIVGLLVVYAKWWAWYGGWFWGPRFFLLACVPASLALATRCSPDANDRPGVQVAVAAAILMSCWVGISGLLFGQQGLEFCTQNRYALESLCHFVPEMSPLWHPFVDFPAMIPPSDRKRVLAQCVWWVTVGLWVARGPIAAVGRALGSRAAAILVRKPAAAR